MPPRAHRDRVDLLDEADRAALGAGRLAQGLEVRRGSSWPSRRSTSTGTTSPRRTGTAPRPRAAMALAVIVLPVPGRPSNSRPRRGVPPICSANCLCVWNRSMRAAHVLLDGVDADDVVEPDVDLLGPVDDVRRARRAQLRPDEQEQERARRTAPGPARAGRSPAARRHDRTAQERVDDDPRLDRDHERGGAVDPSAADPVALDGDVVRASSDGGRDLVGHRHAFPSAPGFRRRCVAGGAICPSWVRPGESAISDIPDHPNGPTRHPSVRSVLRRASTSTRLSPSPSVR